ncbi:MAG: VWA domain-containing protein [Acidobacteriaceae bacterium]|jgi:Ca-activated chloride channel family protein|nr:VWA domain-containing protein [Acidobacteriaceae bacterium]
MRALQIATALITVLAAATLPSAPAVVSLSAGQRQANTPSVDLVELGVTVVDRNGAPVHGLTKDDFELKEEGRTRPLVTFSEVAAGQEDSADSRTIIVLLDDVGIPETGTLAIQTIANLVVDFVDRFDRVAVVRLSKENDAAFGDLLDARTRIRDYRAGIQPFVPPLASEMALTRIGAIARDVMTSDAGRKIVVCIGSSSVCNVRAPQPLSPRHIYERWVEALTESARASLSVYAIIPGRYQMRADSLIEATGGELFATSSDVVPAIQRVLQDANNYYLLGYWPDANGKRRDTYSIQVKSTRKDVTVNARHQRGN